MITVCVHLRNSDVTTDRLAALKAVVSQFPGTDTVEMVISNIRLRLPALYAVDGESVEFYRRARCALDRRGVIHAFDDDPAAW